MRGKAGRVAGGLTVLALLVGAGAWLAPYSSGDPGPPASTVPSCPVAACPADLTGSIEGLAYTLRLPPRWNGTLLVWSHGYQPAGWRGPSSPVAPDAVTAALLLERGYALAGGAWGASGWDVPRAMAAAERVRAHVTATAARPLHVIAWGESLGGLVSLLLVEQHPDRWDAAAPECGTLGGPVRKIDLGADVLTGVRALLDPTLRLDLPADSAAAASRLQRASADLDRADPATLALLAALVDAPGQSRTHDGHDAASRAAARRVALGQALAAATVQRRDLAGPLGGDPARTAGADYSARLDPTERAEVERLHPGRLQPALAALAAVPRLSGIPTGAARAQTPDGNLLVPVVTLHTVADDRVPAQHETVLRDDVARAGHADQLLQLWAAPPGPYDRRPGGAPYGAGHCRFTPVQRLAQVSLLSDWLDTGRRPGAVSVDLRARVAALSAAHAAGPWPGEDRRANPLGGAPPPP